MLEEELVENLLKKSDEYLQEILFENEEVLEAVVLSNSLFSQEIGYEPFSKDWVKRYLRAILSEISNKSADDALGWALTVSVYEVATKLIEYYNITISDYPAIVALAIILIRSAKKL